MKRARSGMLLLEVMLGTAILGMAGVALITLLQQTVETVRQGRATERRTVLATELLNRVSLLSGAALQERIGRSRIGAWTLQVKGTPPLFVMVVRDTLTDAEVLHTTVYRPLRAADAH